VCEEELESLDMSININESSCGPTCICIGPRYNVKCKPLSTCQGGEVICTLKYPGVYIDASCSFSCSVYSSKTPESVTMELLKFKCLPCLHYD